MKRFLHISAIISVFLAIALPAGGVTTLTSKGVDSLMKCAQTKTDDGLLTEALKDLYIIAGVADNDKTVISQTRLASVYLQMGNIHLNYGDTPNSLKFYEKGLNLATDPDQKIKFVANMSVANCISGDEKNARRNSEMLLTIPVVDKKHAHYDYLISQAYIEKIFGSRQKSVTLFKAALDMSAGMRKKGNGHYYQQTPISELSEYYDTVDMLDSAAYYLKSYEEISTADRIPQMIADSQRGLMRLYIKKGDKEKALLYSNKYMSTMDSMVHTDKFIKISSRRQRETEAATAQHIERLEFSVTRLQLILLALAVVAAGILVYWLSRHKFDVVKKQLFARNREIVLLENQEQQPKAEANQWDDLMADIRRVVSDPENFCNPDFSLNTLTQLVGSNSRYVSQAINETTGENFRTLINRYRIMEARRRLTSDKDYANLTIQSIGESVGFKSASNFILAFKKITGLTPASYQKMAKNSAE